MHGGAGRDFLYSGRGRNVLKGEDGNDYLTGGGRLDTFAGGAGDDCFYTFDNHPESIFGDAGHDWASHDVTETLLDSVEDGIIGSPMGA